MKFLSGLLASSGCKKSSTTCLRAISSSAHPLMSYRHVQISSDVGSTHPVSSAQNPVRIANYRVSSQKGEFIHVTPLFRT
jgi:hypothetical protein